MLGKKSMQDLAPECFRKVNPVVRPPTAHRAEEEFNARIYLARKIGYLGIKLHPQWEGETHVHKLIESHIATRQDIFGCGYKVLYSVAGYAHNIPSAKNIIFNRDQLRHRQCSERQYLYACRLRGDDEL